MKNLAMTTFASLAALSLAACGSEDVENTAIDDIDEIVDADVNEEAYPVAGDLNEDQQAAYDAMDRQAVSDEYDTNYDAMMEEQSDSMDGSTGSDSGDAMSDDSMDGSMDASSSSGGMTMPSRSEMDFAWLDRNDDGRLSVAEYAIWALPTDPTEPEPNDATAPYLTQDQINEAGQTFFYFDEDGSTYLSEEEFMTARNSSRTPG